MPYSYTDIVYDEKLNKVREVFFSWEVGEDLGEILERIAWHSYYSLLPQAFLTELLYNVVDDWNCDIWIRLLEIYCHHDKINTKTLALKWYQIEKRLLKLDSQEGACLMKRYRQLDEKLRRYVGEYKYPIFGYFHVHLENYEGHPAKTFLSQLKCIIETDEGPLSLPIIMESNVFLPWLQRKLSMMSMIDSDEFGNHLQEIFERGLMRHIQELVDTDGSTIYQWMSISRRFLLHNSTGDHPIVPALWNCFILLNSNDTAKFLMAKDFTSNHQYLINVVPYWICFGQVNPCSPIERNLDLKTCVNSLERILGVSWKKEAYCIECLRTLVTHSYIDSVVGLRFCESVSEGTLTEGDLSILLSASNHLAHTLSNHAKLLGHKAYLIERSLVSCILASRKRSVSSSSSVSFLSSIGCQDDLLCYELVLPPFEERIPIDWIIECIQSIVFIPEFDSTLLACLGRLLRWVLIASRTTDIRDVMSEIVKTFSLLSKQMEPGQNRMNELMQQGSICFAFLFEALYDLCDLEAELSSRQDEPNILRLTNCLFKMMATCCQYSALIGIFTREKSFVFLLAKLRDRLRPKVQANSSLALQIILQHSPPTIHRRDLFKKYFFIECLIDEGLIRHNHLPQLSVENARMEHSLRCVLILVRDGNLRSMLCQLSLLAALSNIVESQNTTNLESKSDLQIFGDSFKIGLWYLANSKMFEEETCHKFIRNVLCGIVNITEVELIERQIADDLVLLLGLSFQSPALWPGFKEGFTISRFSKKLQQIMDFMYKNPSKSNPTLLNRLLEFSNRLSGFV